MQIPNHIFGNIPGLRIGVGERSKIVLHQRIPRLVNQNIGLFFRFLEIAVGQVTLDEQLATRPFINHTDIRHIILIGNMLYRKFHILHQFLNDGFTLRTLIILFRLFNQFGDKRHVAKLETKRHIAISPMEISPSQVFVLSSLVQPFYPVYIADDGVGIHNPFISLSPENHQTVLVKIIPAIGRSETLCNVAKCLRIIRLSGYSQV